VCLETSLFVHNIHDMKVLHRICDTPLNSRGVCALSASSAGNDGYLAYPGRVDVGEVQVFDAVSLVCVYFSYILMRCLTQKSVTCSCFDLYTTRLQHFYCSVNWTSVRAN